MTCRDGTVRGDQAAPGHSPGQSGAVPKLAKTGPVVAERRSVSLSGRAQASSAATTEFNVAADRCFASVDRGLLKANRPHELWIQHDSWPPATQLRRRLTRIQVRLNSESSRRLSARIPKQSDGFLVNEAGTCIMMVAQDSRLDQSSRCLSIPPKPGFPRNARYRTLGVDHEPQSQFVHHSGMEDRRRPTAAA